MLSDSIRTLVLDEYARRGAAFVDAVDLDAYLVKLGEKAEIVSESVDGRCTGFVAFYCNDLNAKAAYITLVLVDPRDRGRGLGKRLVTSVLDTAKSRGFVSCRLEVDQRNEAAHAMYRALGFRVVELRAHKHLMEAAL